MMMKLFMLKEFSIARLRKWKVMNQFFATSDATMVHAMIFMAG